MSYFGKILDRLWQFLYGIGQVFVRVNSQMLENNLAIWSHWRQVEQKRERERLETDAIKKEKF